MISQATKKAFLSELKYYAKREFRFLKDRKNHPAVYPVHQFLLEHGQFFNHQPLPKGIRKGRAPLCFMYAGRLADQNPSEHFYAEGRACKINQDGGVDLIATHAWAVDRQGNVIDRQPAWQDGGIYFGVPFKYKFYQNALGKCGLWASLLENVPQEILDKPSLEFKASITQRPSIQR